MYLIVGHCCLESTFLGVPEKKQLPERLWYISAMKIGSNRRYRVDSSKAAVDGRLGWEEGLAGGWSAFRRRGVKTSTKKGNRYMYTKGERPVSQKW